MFKRIVVSILFFLIATFIFGCATVIHGTTQQISITTIPPGATVTADTSTTKYITPTSIKLKRKVDHELFITKDDYEPEQIHIYHVFSMAITGNLIVGGVSGWITDSVNGAKSRLVPKGINLTLKPFGTGPIFPKGQTIEAQLKQIDILREQKMISDSEHDLLKKKILKAQPKQ